MASKKAGWLIGCGVIGALFLACGGGCGAMFFWMYKETSAAAKASDEFLAMLGRGDSSGAYKAAAATLKAQQDEKAFDAAMQKLGMWDYSSSAWTGRKINNNVATLDGTVTTRSSGTIPLTVILVKEGGDWKVQALYLSGSPTGIKKPVPTDQEARKLAKDALLDFDKALESGDFTSFHSGVSQKWKDQTTPEELRAAFQQFLDKKIRITGIAKTEAVFDNPPGMENDSEHYVLKGYFPAKPLPVHFDLRFAYEHPNWKLLAIHVKVSKD